MNRRPEPSLPQKEAAGMLADGFSVLAKVLIWQSHGERLYPDITTGTSQRF